MIDLLLKNNEICNVQNVDEIVDEKLDFLIIQFQTYAQVDIDWVIEKFDLDFSIMNRFEDIEISSHFLENDKQISIHFTIPYYNKDKQLVDEPVFIIISKGKLFFFEHSGFDEFINEMYPHKLSVLQQQAGFGNILKLYIEFIADYYADITESHAKKIKTLAAKILIEKKFTEDDLDIITHYSFNNLLIKESINETIRIYNLLRKSNYGKDLIISECINTELTDLAVVSEYIQFNFERLDDLKDNINNKIDLEQNNIIKILTVITFCIALPTLIAGIYGMNFDIMPELRWRYGYLFAILVMILSAFLPIAYFKSKKWLK